MGKAFQGEAIPLKAGCLALNNAAYSIKHPRRHTIILV
jgi:hypothetical protein